jgi:transcriptional regulator with XRE-family HTH domain
MEPLPGDLEEACSLALSLPRAWTRASAGEQLRALRGSRRVSQRHLAELSGFSQSAISRLERGGDASLRTWRRLFSSLGFEAVLTPLPSSEDATDLLLEEAQEREDKIELGRLSRWPTRL